MKYTNQNHYHVHKLEAFGKFVGMEKVEHSELSLHRAKKENADIGLAITKILRTSGLSDPILAKRKALLRQVDDQEKETARRKLETLQEKISRDRAHQTPQVNNHEKALRRTATNGVVTLFNAVSQFNKAVKNNAEETSGKRGPKESTSLEERKDSLKAVSRTSFLQLLRMGGEKTQ